MDTSSDNLRLKDVEYLYTVYFNKCVQDSVVIVAVIIQIKYIIFRYYRSKRKQFFKLFSPKTYHSVQKCLDARLKLHFDYVVRVINDYDFKTVFQMFVVGVYKVLKVLLNCKPGNYLPFMRKILHFTIIKYTVSVPLLNYPDYLYLMDIIDEGQNTNSVMHVFFVTEIPGAKYFPISINQITSPEFEDLMNRASVEFRNNSTFTDPERANLKYVNLIILNYFNAVCYCCIMYY